MRCGRPWQSVRLLALDSRGSWPVLFALALAGGLLLGCGRPEGIAPAATVAAPTIALSGATMGTTYLVKVVDGEGILPTAAELGSLVEAVLDDVDRKMSTWKSDSEVSRFNASRSPQPFEVSKETYEVVSLATEVSRQSGGAFDVTVSPLVDVWGFGPLGEATVAPSPKELEAARRRVGSERLVVEHDPVKGWFLVKEVAGLEIDLSAIAKGFAVDQVARQLASVGADRFMVEVGGEVRTAGSNADGWSWQIAIERPNFDRRQLDRVLPLSNLSLATSGDYRNFYELDGRRVSHTIDPRTAAPIEHRLASVSVLAEDCVWADAWATALNVLGDEGPPLAESLDLAALFLFREVDGSFRQEASTAYSRVIAAAEAVDERP